MAEISIIVPVYRAESYLGACIDSILAQSFQDFELILADDGSPDNCGAICEDYALRDSRIRVLHQENQGQAAARNHAMKMAAGKWLCFVDSDDLIHPQMLEFLLAAVQDSGAAVSMCRMLEGETLREDFYAPQFPEYQVFPMDDSTLAQMYDREDYPGWVACAKLIRRELVEAYPFTQGRVYEDNEAVCRWLCQGGSLARMDHRLYYYRTNPGSTTKSDFSLKKMDYLWALESITRFYGEISFPQMKARFAQRYVDAAISVCYGARFTLNREDVSRETGKRAIRFARQQKIPFSREQRDQMVNAAFPEYGKLYWPLTGAVRTLRDGGVTGLIHKITKRGRDRK